MIDKKGPYHHGNLRHDLIIAGLKLINEEGVERLSLRKAAAMCGVSHSAPQSHFKDKEEFLNAIKNQVTEDFTRAMQEVVDNNQIFENLINEFGRAYVNFFKQNPDYLLFIIKDNRIDVHVSEDKIYDSTYLPFQIFQKNSSEVLIKRGVPKNKLPQIIIELWANVYGLSVLTIMKGFHYEGDWTKMMNSILNGGE